MRGRFAPSPTGYIHLGNVWTALLAWLQVRQAGGTLILRLEDIDEQRSKPQFAEALLEDLHWLGLDWDEGPDVDGAFGPYIQQQRYDKYEAALAGLKGKGLLYPCYCSRARLQAIGAPHAGEHVVYDGHCYGMSRKEQEKMTKQPSWRVHVPPRQIAFSDGVYGLQADFLPETCGDFVVRRADGLYAYQLAVSVDDGAMQVSHVLRGRDLLSSTAQQIWLMETLGYEAPQYTHVPLLLDERGNRFSKRQQGITIRSLRERGIEADAILTFLAQAGGLIPKGRIYGRDELVHSCDLRHLPDTDIVIPTEVLHNL